MMKEFWINLPVKDISKSKQFFTKLGFRFNPQFSDSDEAACLVLGEKDVTVMLFKEAAFEGFTGNSINDTKSGTEVLFSIDAQSREEVDEMLKKAIEAGGIVFGEPENKDGWMYGCGFSDLDGHRWNVLYMDMSNVPN